MLSSPQLGGEVVYLAVGIHAAFKQFQELLTNYKSKPLFFFFLPDFQLLLFIVVTLMFLQRGVLFNYNVYYEVRYQLPWLRAQACSMGSALLVTASLVWVHYLLMALNMTALF